MTRDSRPHNPPIIADGWRLALAAGVVAAAAGLAVALLYARQGLTLSHYDAKAHLVVARRILDGLNPGWVQIGAVWLPLPHLLNMLPVQIDVCYRTGLSAVAMSVASFAAAAAGLTWLVHRATGSAVAALTGTAVFALNPDVLYLQSTPMTEPLLMALVVLSAALAIEAFDDPSPARTTVAGWVMAAAWLTRYEAWPVTAALLGLGALGLLRRGVPWRDVANRVWALARYPAGAAAAFLLLGRASTGAWFTTGGFFVPENVATGRPVKALLSVWWGAHQLTSYALAGLALAGLGLLAWAALRDRPRGTMLVALALVASAALPAYAFYSGHPFRIRYMIPLVPAMAIGLGALVGVPRGRWRAAAAGVVWAALILGPRPLAPGAPMVLEAQWDVPNRLARQAVTRHLEAQWDGRLIMVSMGSLAHYMQELSAAGFGIGDFLHEGNGELWEAALEAPGAHVAWVLVEEQAEGGDVLAQRARAHPRYLEGFVRAAAGGGVVLYRRP